MRNAASEAIAFMIGKSLDDLRSDAMLRRAVVHAVQEIGEAASRVSDQGRGRLSGLSWNKMVGMRHILVHDYWLIDLGPVERVVRRDLPSLVAELDAALAAWPDDGPPEAH